jgi:hypothetical protein
MFVNYFLANIISDLCGSWKHRNACVFEGVAPSINSILRNIKDEHSLWCFAGAKKVEGLGLGGVI